MPLIRSNQEDMRVGIGTRFHAGTWDTEPSGFGTVYKVEDEDLEPVSQDVVMDSSCYMQTVPASLMDAAMMLARSRCRHKTSTNRHGARVGRGRNPGEAHSGWL